MTTPCAIALTVAVFGLSVGCTSKDKTASTSADTSHVSETRATTSEVAPLSDLSTSDNLGHDPNSENRAPIEDPPTPGQTSMGIDDDSDATTSGTTSGAITPTAPSADMSTGTNDTYAVPEGSNDTNRSADDPTLNQMYDDAYSEDTTIDTDSGTVSGSTTGSDDLNSKKKKKAKKKRTAPETDSMDSGSTDTGTGTGTNGSGGM
ncbi:MAG: hypothetical protein AAB250_06120 [Bdellovibrionota bacterium]